MTDVTQPKLLTRDDFLSGNHLKRELVEVPELGGSVFLRELSTPQLLALKARVRGLSGEGREISEEDSVGLMAFVLALSACDESGDLLFTEDDTQALINNKLDVLMRLGTKALGLVGLDINLNMITSLKKTQTSSSFSGSPRNSKKRSRRS